MNVEHVVFFVEEPSAEVALVHLLPRMLGGITFEVHQFGGKARLLSRLPARLAAYERSLPPGHRIVVVVDRDEDDCVRLKRQLLRITSNARLKPKQGEGTWQVAHRIAIEELEAWFFGDWQAVLAAYPRVPATVPKKSPYRNPDGIKGGTWEALERILQEAGYFPGGLAKIELARTISAHMEPARNASKSFGVLRSLLKTL